MELHSPEPDLYAITHGVVGHRPIGRKQRQLRGLLRIFIKGFDHTAPRLVLAVVDLAEIENLALHDLAAGAALALNNAPIAVFLASAAPAARSCSAKFSISARSTTASTR